MNQVVWSVRKASTFLSEYVSGPVRVIKTGVEGWKPYKASNGLRLVEADLLELYVNSA